jgi:5-formyltetrahydrofolate cyclo-ligase
VSGDRPEHDENEIRRRAKLALRKRLRSVRATLPRAACDARSSQIVERLLELDELRGATTVLAFASIGNEVRLAPLIDAMWAAGKRVALPRVVDGELELGLADAGTTLVEGAFSVPEPPEDAEKVQPDEVQLVLVPALAVDPRGYRIGYGGGYYDRLLPRLERACACAVAYDFQLVAEVPQLPFDVAVDLVVTDRRVLRTH